MRNSMGKVENLYFRDPKCEILSFHHESFCTSVSGIYHPSVFPEYDRNISLISFCSALQLITHLL